MPPAAVPFREVQTLGSNRVVLIILASSGAGTFLLLGSLAIALPHARPTLLGVLALIVLVDSLVLWGIRITTRVGPDGVHVRFGPITACCVPLGDILRAEAVTYNWIDHGGWGWRSSKRDGRVLTLLGDRAIKLETRRRKYLIGTQRPEEFLAALVAAAPN